MPKLLQIDACSNWGSTGKIVEQIGLLAESQGWEVLTAYGRYSNPSKLRRIKVGNKFSTCEHYFEHRFLDREGLASRIPTRKLIQKIEGFSPDVVQLHDIHDHWLNYHILFEYLNKKQIPVVWTQHDCWSFTGHCSITIDDCDRWLGECNNCPQRRRFCIDQSKKNFNLKKELFSKSNITLVSVSDWLFDIANVSFFKDTPIRVIPNGIDIEIFKPLHPSSFDKSSVNFKHLILGVATAWGNNKGLYDYYKLAAILPDDYRIALVGLSRKQINDLPPHIIGIEKTSNVQDLVELYNIASVVTSLSYSETFGLTLVEAMACGTPLVAYNNTGQAALVTDDVGRLVTTGNIEDVKAAIEEITSYNKKRYSSACRNRAVEKYDKNARGMDYINLYNELIRN